MPSAFRARPAAREREAMMRQRWGGLVAAAAVMAGLAGSAAPGAAQETTLTVWSHFADHEDGARTRAAASAGRGSIAGRAERRGSVGARRLQ